MIRNDSFYRVPQRLHVLMGYGEGPHIAALSILPAALALSYAALRTGSRRALAGASLLSALTVMLYFYGATALALFYSLLAWSVWVGQRRRAVLLTAAAIPVLAYLLCAFWLTPSYLAVTMRNLELVARPGNLGSRLIPADYDGGVRGGVVVVGPTGVRSREWTIFAVGSAIVFSLFVLGYYYGGLLLAGDAPRLLPEFDLAMILVFVELLRRLWLHPKLRMLAVAAAAPALASAYPYLQNPYFPFPKVPSLNDVYEYQMTRWLHEHLPGERILPTGSLRFWFDAWFDNTQMTGGSEQGVLNRLLPGINYQITAGDQTDLAVLWLQSVGTDAIVVSDQTSRDAYRDFHNPEKFRGLLEPLYNNGRGSVVYRVPRWQPGIGRVVDRAKINAAATPFANYDAEGLRRYAEHPSRSRTNRGLPSIGTGFDEFTIEASVGAGQSLLVQETYDRYWQAYEHGRRLAVRRDPMNFLLIDVPEGTHDVEMRFATPLENRVGQTGSLLGLAVVVGLLVRRTMTGELKPGAAR